VNSQIYADWLEENGQDAKAALRRHKVAVKRHPGLRWPRVRQLDGLSDHQRQQMAVALSRPVGILTGTPGTGKSYCAVQLVSCLAHHHGLVGAICAPTGKAAVRLNTMLGLSWARTIHQLLGVSRNGHDGEGWGFIHDANNPLPIHWLIVDEASMLNTDLAAAIFSACRPGTHILLVGDRNQLPPVGHGAPLRDMIAAGVPCGRLTEIQRNAGHVVEVCAAIQAEEHWGPAGNLEHHECPTAPEQIATLQHVLDRQRRHGYDPVWDVQVLAAVNSRGELSRQNLNRLMQEQLNAPVPDGLGRPWLLGDKLVCLRNHWAQPESTRSLQVYVANGDVGRVVDIGPGRVIVHLPTPERRVSVPLLRTTRDTDPGAVPDDDRRAPWDLAYALTAHKSQGSEWPVVILMIDESPAARLICTREWVYTALSRGKELVITIGRLSVLKQMCARQSLEKRKTFLTELLTDGK
jgi:exodeoxyribonuclease V alpha subunit